MRADPRRNLLSNLVPVPILVLVLLIGSGCEPRQPLTAGGVAGIADGLQFHRGLHYGPALRVFPPGDDRDVNGRRWWMVWYAPAPDGSPRAIRVDADSGWAQLEPQLFADDKDRR